MTNTRFKTLVLLLGLSTVAACNRAEADPNSADSGGGGKADDADGVETAVDDVRITILSTHIADFWDNGHDDSELPVVEGQAGDPIGHEGWAALVEIDVEGGTRRVLVDTGSRPEVVLKNAEILGMLDELAATEEVLLTHWHYDHVDGLPGLREALREQNPAALSTVYVSKYAFVQRDKPSANKTGINHIADRLDEWKRTFADPESASVVELGDAPYEIAPGLWATGFVPRITHSTALGDLVEESYPGKLTVAESISVETDNGAVELAAGDVDLVPDSQSLVVETSDGLAIVTGCGHAGVANIVAHARDFTDTDRVSAVVGGLHLWATSEDYVRRVGSALLDFDVAQVLGGHCSGINPVFVLREAMGLSDAECTVASVGFGYHFDDGGVRLGQVNQSLPAE